MIKKEEIIRKINEKLGTAKSFIDIAYIFGSGAWMDKFKTYTTEGGFEIVSEDNIQKFIFGKPSNLVKNYSNSNLVNDVAINLVRSGYRDFMTQSFDLIIKYCKDTNQNKKLKELPWYHFSRLVRNSFSHDFKLNFELYGDQLLPDQKLEFSNRTIEFTQSMNGREITFDLFRFSEIEELVEMMKKSITNDLV